MSRARIGDYIMGWKVGSRRRIGKEIFHLLFVDNPLTCCEAKEEQIIYLL